MSKIGALVVVFGTLLLSSVAQDVTISAKKVYDMYEPYFVVWTDTCSCHSYYDEIQIFHSDGTPQYISDRVREDGGSGNTSILTVPGPGANYFAYVRSEDTIAQTFNFSVQANYVLSAPATVVLGQPIEITFTCSPWMGYNGKGVYDYIGIWPVGTTNLQRGYTNYQYVSETCQNGKGKATIPGIDDSVPTLIGIYRMATDLDHTWANNVTIKVVSGVTMKPSKSSFAINEDITIDFTAPKTHSLDDRIYLYRGDETVGEYLQSAGIPVEQTSGQVTFNGYGSDDLGTYTVVYKAGDITEIEKATFTVSVFGASGASTIAVFSSFCGYFVLFCVIFLM